MRIKQLIKSRNNFYCDSKIKDFLVEGISCNSKKVSNNFVFVAIKGSQENGNAFIKEAIGRGAKAVIVQSSSHKVPPKAKPPTAGAKSAGVNIFKVKDTRFALAKLAAQFYSNPSRQIKLVGITGTNGKTTVSYLLEAILKHAKFSPGVIGTVNYRFQNRVIPAKNTTPGPIELQSILAEMSKKGMDYCLIEVSSHALDQKRIEGIDFHSAIFTNLTQDHLDYHKTIENYFQSKAKLFRGLEDKSFAVINSDDKYSQRIRRLTRAKVITYGIENDAQVTAKNINFGSLHTEFLLVAPRLNLKLRTQLIGRHNLYNVLAAVSWAVKEGIPSRTIKSAIEGFSSVPGRLERVGGNRDFSIFVDYAHTEDALKNVITSLRQFCKKRIIVVFGCGGERDKTKRPKMGRIVTELSDYAIITNDNPRREDPAQIICDIKQGIIKRNFCVIPHRRQAIKKSLSLAKGGDIVLIAGKGHEDYQILGKRVLHFNDREVVRECLRSMN